MRRGLLTTEHRFHRKFLYKTEAEWQLNQGQTEQSLDRPSKWVKGWIGKGTGDRMNLGIERLDGFSFSRILEKSDPGTNQTRGRDSFGRG